MSVNNLFRQLLFVASFVTVSALGFGCAKDDGNASIAPEVTTDPYFELRLYAPGDYGSSNWRIPALRALPDGSLLVLNDKRKHNQGDLPEDIDIVARRSVDNGRTWGDPVNVAVGTGYKHGFGDPAIVTAVDGTVVAAYVGGNGLWASSPSDPQCSYIVRSVDGGQTWSAPNNITSLLWGASAQNQDTRVYTASFFGSGNGLLLTRGQHAGRIMFVAAMCRNHNALDNYAVYSDDNGLTWHVSKKAYTDGDEAKVVELVDGSILMSVRRSGARGYAISHDGGETWDEQGTWPDLVSNACNGDIVRYSATDRGGERNILLHSLPNSLEREKVSVFVSYDEGRSWQLAKTLCTGSSAYSSLTVLPNGTIGAYVEKGPSQAYELWYYNFTLDWLLN